MTWSSWYDDALEILRMEYGDRESRSILRILKEDLNIASDSLSDGEYKLLKKCLGRLMQHEPVQYITGLSYFLELKLKVTRHVLIPRPETEELTYSAIQYLKSKSIQIPKVLDVGTGSGAIALALKMNFPDANVTAVDKSLKALDVAQYNAGKLNLSVDFVELDFLDPFQWSKIAGLWDLIISNPPYIPQSEMEMMTSNAKQYEPKMALFTEDVDGLEFYHALAQYSHEHLEKGGLLIVEINEYRSAQTILVFENAGYKTEVNNDLSGKPRTLMAYKK